MAKKNTAKKSAKKRPTTRRAPKATPRVQSPPLVRLVNILGAQVADLTAVMFELHDVARARSELARAGVQKDVLLEAESKEVALKFKKTSGPDFVSIELSDKDEEVLRPNTPEGTSAPRRVGAEIDAFIVVKGDFGQEAVIELSNAIPKIIRMSAFPGETGNQGTRRLVVVG